MRRDTLTITSQQAGHPITKTIYLKHLTGIAPSSMGDSIAVCYHSTDLHLYLSEAETLDFIGKTWRIRDCRFYRVNQCWGARQTDKVPSVTGYGPGCIGCQLRKIVMDRTREDLRASLPDKPRNPLWPSFLIATAFLGQAYWFGQIGQTAMQRAARAERELRAYKQATFKRQGEGRGKR